MRQRAVMETKRSEWYVIGVVMGASVTAAIATLLMTLDWRKGLVEWAKDWQTLIAGFMALGGAYLSVRWIQRQIDHARDQENDRIERAHYADRATMAAALSELVNYAKDALEAFKQVPTPTSELEILEPPSGWTMPQLPRVSSDAIGVLRACIETAEVGPRAEIAKLLEHLQICNSRLYGFFHDEFVAKGQSAISQHNMHTHFADFLELHVRSDDMISYARGETADIENPATLGRMNTRAIFANLEHYPGLNDELKARYPET